jgi:hypothetical protein
MIVNVVDDRAHARSIAGQVAEQLPCSVADLVGLAIAAGQQVDERLVGKISDGPQRFVGHLRFVEAAIADDARDFEL